MDIKNRIKSISLSPGIYIFKDKNAQVLYVGKAGNLRNRVKSYWQKTTDLTEAKKQMVAKIANIETIITANNEEALILEAVMIKKYRPKYNVILKDDKNYQFIKIDFRVDEPIVTTARRPEEDRGRSQSRYFGPYTSGLQLKENLRLLRRVFPWRKKAGKRTRFEEDLLVKRSLGPIPHNAAEYQTMIKNFIHVLGGHGQKVINDLQARMKQLSLKQNYERAALVRNQILALKQINSTQNIVSMKSESQDVISIFKNDDLAAVNLFLIRQGKLIDKLSFLLQNTQDESLPSLLDAFLSQYYKDATNIPKEIIIPVRTSLRTQDLTSLINNPVNLEIASSAPPPRNDIKITIPHRGKKRELIKLGEQNAREYLEQSLASWRKQDVSDILKQLQMRLKLPKLPRRIEGYDISNIQGQLAVGSMVVFTDGQPDKNKYRKFKIKTIKNADDFAMLAEVLKRRFANQDWLKPDLILLDGGKGQLSVALNTLFPVIASERRERSNLRIASARSSPRNDIKPNQFIALAKKWEEIFQGPNLRKINILSNSPASFLLQRVRDEAHRFAQKYYHTRHTKANKQSILDEVPDIGPKTRKLLVHKFGSISGIHQADKKEIIKLIGKIKAENLLENL